jgi:competence protein ComEA
MIARIGAAAVVLVVLAAIGHFAATRAAALATASKVDAGDVRASVTSVASTEPPPDAGSAPTSRAPVVTSTSATSATRATPEDPVYVNYASAEELRRLPGVGPKRADAIVALRGRMGRFQRVEDLMRVKGIGRATIKKLRPLIRLGEPPAKDAGTP